jgi:pyruvate,water dikinase
VNSSKLIFWIEDIGKQHNDVVGKKCANLGEMTKMGLPVPPGFALTLNIYQKFLTDTGLAKKISSYIHECGDLKGKSVAIFDEVSRDLRSMTETQKMPSSLEDEIKSCYEQLCNKLKILNMAVSVRSSGTTSRPGMFETYLNVKGKDDVLEKVKRVWASTFTPRAIAFRANKDMPIDCDMLGVAVIKMVNAKSAGIGFTVNPITGDDSKIIIEANWGLGEGVVSGEENVDRWVVNKKNWKILERAIGNKIKYVINKEKGAVWYEVPVEKRSKPCLADDEIKRVAKIAKLLEDRLGAPQDIEFAIDLDLPKGKNIVLLQTRPAKTVAKQSATEKIAEMIAERYV